MFARFKKWVQLCHRMLPHGIRVHLRWTYWAFVAHKKLRMERKEAERIRASMQKNGIRNALIVYDALASPPTYGDYFLVLMLARYFTSQGISVKFVIVDGEYRDDWCHLSEFEKKQLVQNYIESARLLLAPSLAAIEISNWVELQDGMQNDKYVNFDIVFKEQILNRKNIYSHVMNTLNLLIDKPNQVSFEKFFLAYEDLVGKVDLRKLYRPYVTWGCRYSTKWSIDRNLSDELFPQIYAQLKSLYPTHAILVISDDVGCAHFKKIAELLNLECFFSKDFSKSILGDGALILGSSYFYMMRGGGIAVFPIFSRIPYELISYAPTEDAWKERRLTSWATRYQIFRYSTLAEKNPLPTLMVSTTTDDRYF